jgi:tRNA nucleotidyltransferase (CCA-adding enzyme)
MYDLQNAKILDHWGGLEDLKARRLRCVDPGSFIEDSLRVLRAMRFAAQLGFRVEEGTCRLCREIPLDDLPGARIFGEFERMFRSRFWERGLYELLNLGIASRLWGEKRKLELLLPAAKEMIRYRPFILPELYDYTFLAIYGQHTSVPMERILDTIDAPNRYRRRLERLPKIPETITPSFVAALARKEGVRASVLGYHPVIRRMAKKLGVWDRPLDLGVTPQELMDRGFRGKALGEELDRLYRLHLQEIDNML